MPFVKEYVSQNDAELFNSFEMYNYDTKDIRRWDSLDKQKEKGCAVR